MTSVSSVDIFLCGDLMLGRGVDQALAPASAPPRLYESSITDARYYNPLSAGEKRTFEELWGDALLVLEERQPHFAFGNLETAITARGTPDPQKGIHYRMHPDNAEALSVLNFDAVSLANNHTLDWGPQGLTDTLDVLEEIEVNSSGADMTKNRPKNPPFLSLTKWGKVKNVLE